MSSIADLTIDEHFCHVFNILTHFEPTSCSPERRLRRRVLNTFYDVINYSHEAKFERAVCVLYELYSIQLAHPSFEWLRQIRAHCHFLIDNLS